MILLILGSHHADGELNVNTAMLHIMPSLQNINQVLLSMVKATEKVDRLPRGPAMDMG